jgi:hypothetical protein
MNPIQDAPSSSKYDLDPDPDRLQPRWMESVWVGIGWLLFFWFTQSGHDFSEGNLAHSMASHLVRTGQISLAEPHPEFGYLFQPGTDARYHPAHEFGNTLLMVPFVAVIELILHVGRSRFDPAQSILLGRFLASFIPGIFAAVGIVIFHRLARHVFHLHARSALFATFGLGAATFYWTYAQSLSDLLLTSVLLLLAVTALFAHRHTHSPLLIIGASAALGMAIVTRIPSILLLPPFVGYLLWVHRGSPLTIRHPIVSVVLSLVPFALWQLYYNHLRTGNPFFGPVNNPVYINNRLDGNLAEGIVGMLFSPGKNIFLYCPILILSLGTFPRFWKRHTAEAVMLTASILFWFLLHAKLRGWTGTTGFGPRFLVAITPLLCIPWMASLAFNRYPSRTWIWLTRICFSWGILLGICATISSWFYRYGFLNATAAMDDWHPLRNHTVDIITSAFANIRRLFTNSPPDIWDIASPLHQFMANSVDIWLVLAWKQGLPAPLACIIGITMLASAIAAWRASIRSTPTKIAKGTQ